jgi:hypothetical protein
MHLHSNFHTFPDLYPQPNRPIELREDWKGWEDRNNKTASRDHVHFYEVLLEKCKNCRQETICSKMLIFKSKMF